MDFGLRIKALDFQRRLRHSCGLKFSTMGQELESNTSAPSSWTPKILHMEDGSSSISTSPNVATRYKLPLLGLVKLS